MRLSVTIEHRTAYRGTSIWDPPTLTILVYTPTK